METDVAGIAGKRGHARQAQTKRAALQNTEGGGGKTYPARNAGAGAGKAGGAAEDKGARGFAAGLCCGAGKKRTAIPKIPLPCPRYAAGFRAGQFFFACREVRRAGKQARHPFYKNVAVGLLEKRESRRGGFGKGAQE